MEGKGMREAIFYLLSGVSIGLMMMFIVMIRSDPHAGNVIVHSYMDGTSAEETKEDSILELSSARNFEFQIGAIRKDNPWLTDKIEDLSANAEKFLRFHPRNGWPSGGKIWIPQGASITRLVGSIAYSWTETDRLGYRADHFVFVYESAACRLERIHDPKTMDSVSLYCGTFR